MELRFWIVGVVASCGACLVATEEPARPRAVEGSPAAPDEVLMTGVSSEVFERDELRSRARAANLRVDRKSGNIVATRVEVQRFDPKTKQSTGKLSASRARGHLQQRDVSLEGNVELMDKEARKATTERADYVEKEGVLKLPGRVRVAGDNFEATGASAVYHIETEKLEVSPPVEIVVREAAR